MRISDWSSDVCSSDLVVLRIDAAVFKRVLDAVDDAPQPLDAVERIRRRIGQMRRNDLAIFLHAAERQTQHLQEHHHRQRLGDRGHEVRSEEHTSELQSLMRISYAVFCLKTKNNFLIKYQH